jgi:hypothetical protein
MGPLADKAQQREEENWWQQLQQQALFHLSLLISNFFFFFFFFFFSHSLTPCYCGYVHSVLSAFPSVSSFALKEGSKEEGANRKEKSIYWIRILEYREGGRKDRRRVEAEQTN